MTIPVEQPTAEAPAFPILYRDRHLLAVHKPPGWLVHRSDADRHETRFLLQLVRAQTGQHLYPVHRLDKPTSGVLLFALNREAARRLGEAFTHQRVDKRYLAVVRGHAPEQGIIDHPLGPGRHSPKGAQAQSPQPAVTEYRTLARVELPLPVGRYPCSRYCLVEVRPRSGRTHQIRRHFKHISHPLIGDTSFGKGEHNRLFQEHLDCRRLLLAAVELGLEHPFSREPLSITAPLEGEFRAVVERLGWLGSLPPAWGGSDGCSQINSTSSTPPSTSR